MTKLRPAFIPLNYSSYTTPDPDAVDVELAPHIYANRQRLCGFPTIEPSRLEARFIYELWRRGCSVESIMRSYRYEREAVIAAIGFGAGIAWQLGRRKSKRKKKPLADRVRRIEAGEESH